MIRRGVILSAVLAAVLTTAGVAATRPAASPAFEVSITSTYVRHHVENRVSGSTCLVHHELDTTLRMDVHTSKPAVRTLAQLAKGGNNFVAMDAVEQRSGGGHDYGTGCNADNCHYAFCMEDTTPETSDCGTRSYTISPIGIGVGYLNGNQTRFVFFYTNIAKDHFAHCLTDYYSNGHNMIVNFPPGQIIEGSAKRPFWVDVDRDRLRAGKTVVVKWSTASTVSYPAANDQPLSPTNIVSDEFTVSWTVKLVPVR